MWQAIIWTNADPIHWRIYAALGGDELMTMMLDQFTDMKFLSDYWLQDYIIGSSNGLAHYRQQIITLTMTA